MGADSLGIQPQTCRRFNAADPLPVAAGPACLGLGLGDSAELARLALPAGAFARKEKESRRYRLGCVSVGVCVWLLPPSP